MGREDDEPLPDFSVFPPTIGEFESPPGTYYDAWPLLVMTTSALDALAAAVPDSVVDVRRFRPSIVIDTVTTTREHARPPGVRLEGPDGHHRHGRRSSSSTRARAV